MCYLGGTLALASRNGFPASYMDIGKQLIDTCWEMYRRMPTGLSPEIVYFNTLPDAKDDLFVKVGKLFFLNIELLRFGQGQILKSSKKCVLVNNFSNFLDC